MNLLTVFRGDNVEQLFQVQRNLLPQNLEDCVITITLANDSDQDEETVTLTSELDGGITVVDEALGTFTVVMTSEQTQGLLPVKEVDLDIVVENGDEEIQTFRVKNGLTVLKRNP